VEKKMHKVRGKRILKKVEKKKNMHKVRGKHDFEKYGEKDVY
jgi:hypothetical protein